MKTRKKINLKPHTEKNQQNPKLQEFSADWLRFLDLIDQLYLGKNKILANLVDWISGLGRIRKFKFYFLTGFLF